MEDNYKADKDFTDYAWGDMKAMLDKEMPEAAAVITPATTGTDKRWLLLLLLLFLLGLLTAGVVYYQGDMQIANPNPVAKVTTTPVVPSTTMESSTSEKDAALELPASIVADDAKEVSTTVQPNKVKLPTETLNATSNKTSERAHTNKSEINSDENKLDFFNTNGGEGKETNVVQQEIAAMEMQILKEQNGNVAKEVEAENINLADRLVVKEVAFVDTRNVDLLNVKEEEVLKNRKTKVACPLEKHLAVVAGIRSYDFEIQPNIALGAEAIFRKTNRKLGLRTGIYYAQRNTSFLIQERQVNSFTANDLDDNFGVESSNADINEFNAERSYIEQEENLRYHFLELALSTDFKITDKWSLFGGAQTSLLMFSASRNFGVFDFNRNNSDLTNIPDTTSSGEVLIGEPTRSSAFVPRKVNIAAQIGVDYRLNSRLSMTAKYSENLLDIYPSIIGSQRSRFVEAGIKWWLK